MKTQVIDQNRTIHHALHLNEELQTLRKENKDLIVAVEELKTEREESNRIIESLETKIEEIQSKETAISNSSEERRLKAELQNLRLSWDAMYADLAKIRKERDELKSAMDETNKGKAATAATFEKPQQKQRQAESRGFFFENISRASSWIGGGSGEAYNIYSKANINHGVADQASLIQNAVERKSSLQVGVATPSAGITTTTNKNSSMERKLQEAEIENLKLRSTIVQLRTQLHEERYRNQPKSDKPSSPPRSRSMQPRTTTPLLRSTKWGGDPYASSGIRPNPTSVDSCNDDSTSDEAPSAPRRSASLLLRRIQEYENKNLTVDVTKTSEELNASTTTNTTVTASESGNSNSSSSSSSSNESDVEDISFTRSRLREMCQTKKAQSLCAGSSISTNTKWGRSPARDLHRETNEKSILTSHPAHRQKQVYFNGDDRSTNLSPMKEESSTHDRMITPPKRSQSLIGRR
jgi:hypothetical protein